MSRLTFSVTTAGLEVTSWIGLDGQTTAKLLGAGKSVVAPVQVRGLLDTGTNVTAVPSWVLQQLGVIPVRSAVTHTAAGQAGVNLYDVSLSITDPSNASSPWLTIPHLLVMGLPATLPDTDVLIGRDVLLQLKLSLDGIARRFELEF